MELEAIKARLARLEARVARLETAQEHALMREEAPVVVPDDRPAPLPAAETERRSVPPPLPPRPAPADPVPPVEDRAESPAAVPPPAVVLPYAPRPAPAEPIREGAWEQTIGLKVAGWVGALVLVIGAGLGVKYGYERWVVNLAPEVRLSLMAIFGLALIGAGEWVHRRVHVWSAVGLFGAGVATLFLVSYGGHGHFDLYSRDTAFILMGLTTLIGAAVAMRGRMVSIAVLSILGGNLAPVVLGGDTGRIVEFMSYLLMLQVVALVLSAWGNQPRWWSLRWLSLVTTGLWALSLIMQVRTGRIDSSAPLAFTLIYGVLFMAELAIASLRTGTGASTGEQSVTFSLLVTAGLVGATLLALHESAPVVRGAWVIGFAAAEALLGWTLARRARREGAPRDAGMLAVALRIQAAALVVVAVPVALAGPAVPIAWGILALAFGVVGWRLDLTVSRIAAVITWVLAVAYIPWSLASDDPAREAAMRRILLAIAGQDVPVYAILGALMALVGQAVAWLIGGERIVDDNVVDAALTPMRSAELERGGVLLSMVGGGVWFVTAQATFDPIPAALAIIASAWLVALGDIKLPRLKLAMQGMVVIALATIKWLMIDLIAQRIGGRWDDVRLGYLPLVNPIMGVGVLLAASLAGIFFLRRSSLRPRSADAQSSALFAVLSACIVAMTLALTMEIDRIVSGSPRGMWQEMHVKMLCWTMLWSIATAALGAAAWWTTADIDRRHARLALLSPLALILLFKHMTLDTLAFRVMARGAPGVAFANPEALASLLVLATLIGGWWLLRQTRPGRRAAAAAILGFGAMLLVLFTGTLESSRLVGGGRATQVAWSIWWSVFAVICVTGGLLWRIKAMRFFGLGLFAVTVVKVFFVDLQGVSSGWRTLSFIGLGLLLIGTSVLYGKFSPKLLAARRA